MVCRTWGIRPEDFWGTWSVRERALARGLQALEDSTGPNGFPRELEEDPDQDGYFEVTPIVNYATKAIHDYMTAKGDKLDPGTRFRVVHNRPSEEDLSEYR